MSIHTFTHTTNHPHTQTNTHTHRRSTTLVSWRVSLRDNHTHTHTHTPAFNGFGVLESVVEGGVEILQLLRRPTQLTSKRAELFL